MRVVVTGLVATYPVGGVAWDYLQYVQGFRALGCEVTYLEDTGQRLYDPAAQTFTDDVRANACHLNDALASLEPALARRWSLRAPDGTYHGLDEPAVARVRGRGPLLEPVRRVLASRRVSRGACEGVRRHR